MLSVVIEIHYLFCGLKVLHFLFGSILLKNNFSMCAHKDVHISSFLNW